MALTPITWMSVNLDPYSDTLLHIAVYKGCEKIAQLLLDESAKVDAKNE